MNFLDSPSTRLRYAALRGLAGRSRTLGGVYAEICGRTALLSDPGRADTASARICRWTGLSASQAHQAYRRALVSEAREEADAAFFVRHGEALDPWFPDTGAIPRPAGPVVYATLHFGHPVLSCVYLRRRGGMDVRPILRGLDAANPMADAKRRWGERKVSWVRELLDDKVFGADGVATVRAREHLLGGGAIFAALDVPGNVSDRSSTVELFGESLRFSSGIVSLAAMTESTIVPLVALSGTDRMSVHFGGPVCATVEDPLAAVFAELVPFIVRFPDQWWLWPYLEGE